MGVYKALDSDESPNDCKVLLDSSVLLQVYEGVDVVDLINDELGSCEYYVLDCILSEISGIARKSMGFKGRAAVLALDYIQKRGITIINSFKLLKCLGDESILSFFISNEDLRRDFIVATNDDVLKKELLRLGVKVVTWWTSKSRYILLNP